MRALCRLRLAHRALHRAASVAVKHDAPVTQLLDAAAASWGARATGAHLASMLAAMHATAGRPPPAALARLGWLATHRPLTGAASALAGALLCLGAARLQGGGGETRGALTAATAALQAAQGAALPLGVAVSVLSSCLALTAQCEGGSPWVAAAAQDTAAAALRATLGVPLAAGHDPALAPLVPLLAHALAGNDARLVEAGCAVLQGGAGGVGGQAALALASTALAGSALAGGGGGALLPQAASAWTGLLQRSDGHWGALGHAAAGWSVAHIALAAEEAGKVPLAAAAAAGVLGGPSWELSLRVAAATGAGAPAMPASGHDVRSRLLAWDMGGEEYRADSAAWRRRVAPLWPDPLTGLLAQVHGVAGGGVQRGSGDAYAALCASAPLVPLPPPANTAWPPPQAVSAAAVAGAQPPVPQAGLAAWQYDVWLGFGDAGELLVEAGRRVAARLGGGAQAPAPVHTFPASVAACAASLSRAPSAQAWLAGELAAAQRGGGARK